MIFVLIPENALEHGKDRVQNSTKQYKQKSGWRHTVEDVRIPQHLAAGSIKNMKHLRKELQHEVTQQLERKRLALFEVREKNNRKQDRLYEQLTETLDCLSTRKHMNKSRRKQAK